MLCASYDEATAMLTFPSDGLSFPFWPMRTTSLRSTAKREDRQIFQARVEGGEKAGRGRRPLALLDARG